MTQDTPGRRTLTVALQLRDDKSQGYVFAESELRPELRNAHAINEANQNLFKHDADEQWNGVEVMRDMVAVTRAGDMSMPSDIPTAQAMTLDAIFTECVRKSIHTSPNIPKCPSDTCRWL